METKCKHNVKETEIKKGDILTQEVVHDIIYKRDARAVQSNVNNTQNVIKNCFTKYIYT